MTERRKHPKQDRANPASVGAFLAALLLAAIVVIYPPLEWPTPFGTIPAMPVKLAYLSRVIPADSARILAPLANPVMAALKPLNADPVLRQHIANSVVQEAVHYSVSEDLILGIIQVENDRLNPRATSSVGALGLMQVMPFHAGMKQCQSGNLRTVDSNICHGVAVFADALRRYKGNTRSALLAYNGCVGKAARTSCRRYPDKVLEAARIAGERIRANE